jgi:hypothetical protein
MYRLALPVALMLLGTACSKYYYVELLEGDWVGTATGADGPHPMVASFTFDEDKEKSFGGTVDIDGAVYNVTGAKSDKESASISLYNALRTGELKNVVVEEETTMKGDYTDNGVAGTFELELQ